jgi:hypothetical protein
METKNLILVNKLPVTPEISNALTRTISSYSAAGIDIEITSFVNNIATVIIRQSRLINGYILNQKQLVERCKEAFGPHGIDTIVVPVVFSLSVENITVDWIKLRMEEFGIKRNDLISQMAFDKSYISRLFGNGKSRIELSKQVKGAFFYYFLTYELNRDLREQM